MSQSNSQTTTDDPATAAGWLCDTPWISWGLALFDKTQEGAVARAEASRAAKIEELEQRIADIRRMVVEPVRVEAETNG